MKKRLRAFKKFVNWSVFLVVCKLVQAWPKFYKDCKCMQRICNPNATYLFPSQYLCKEISCTYSFHGIILIAVSVPGDTKTKRVRSVQTKRSPTPVFRAFPNFLLSLSSASATYYCWLIFVLAILSFPA